MELVNNYPSIDNYIEEAVKPLPDNISKFTSAEGFSHYINQSKNETHSNIYNYINRTVDDLIENTKHLWEKLQIDETITPSNKDFCIDKMFEFLKSLKDVFGIDIYSPLKPLGFKVLI